MDTSAITTTTQECRECAAVAVDGAVDHPGAINCTSSNTVTWADSLPILPGELDLMRIYFGDLISAVLKGDA